MLDGREPPTDHERTSLHRPVDRRRRRPGDRPARSRGHAMSRATGRDGDLLADVSRAVAKLGAPVDAKSLGEVLELHRRPAVRAAARPAATRRRCAAIGSTRGVPTHAHVARAHRLAVAEDEREHVVGDRRARRRSARSHGRHAAGRRTTLHCAAIAALESVSVCARCVPLRLKRRHRRRLTHRRVPRLGVRQPTARGRSTPAPKPDAVLRARARESRGGSPGRPSLGARLRRPGSVGHSRLSSSVPGSPP